MLESTTLKGPSTPLSRRLPFVEAHEVDEAKALIRSGLPEGEPPRPAGYYVLVKIYVRKGGEKLFEATDGKTGQKVEFVSASVTEREDRYQSVVALVMDVGPEAYRGVLANGSPRYPDGPWCRPGDWVLLPRYEGFTFDWKGVAMQLIPDDRIMAVVEEPADYQATFRNDRY
jgi:hypothetical protein